MTLQGWFDLKDKIRRYFRFSVDEIRMIIIYTLILAFIFSFKDWGVDSFNPAYGSARYMMTAIVVGFGVLVHEVVHKIAAIYIGFRYDGRIWTYGLIFGLIITFVTNGRMFFIAGTGVFFFHLGMQRVGIFRYGLNYWDQAKASYPAPLANLLLAGLFKIFSIGSIIVPAGISTESYIISQAIRFNLWYAVFNMLPIPPLDGALCFFASRGWYVFMFGCILIYSALILIAGVYSLFAALIGGIVISALFYYFFERAG